MNAIALLKQMHQEAKSAFQKLEQGEPNQRLAIWDKLQPELVRHEELEETLFYPELKKVDTTEEIILEAYQEHHVMDVLIKEISALKPGDEAFQPKVTVLQENTEHHIEEEEQDLFPKVRKLWDRAKREKVGAAMEEQAERAKDKRAA